MNIGLCTDKFYHLHRYIANCHFSSTFSTFPQIELTTSKANTNSLLLAFVPVPLHASFKAPSELNIKHAQYPIIVIPANIYDIHRLVAFFLRV